MGLRVVSFAMWVACSAAAQVIPQAPASPQVELQVDLKNLSEAAQSLQRDLPSFTCTETGVSQALKKGKVKTEVQFVANVRVERAAAGRLDEELEVSEVNGKPVKDRFDPPFMVGGGFAESLFYFLPASQACFLFTVGAGRVDFVAQPGVFDRPQCKAQGDPRGFVLLDGAGNPTHVERRVQHEAAEDRHIVDFSATDFTLTELDGKTYPLAAKVVADEPKEDGWALHFEATFAGCHLFKATSRILPGETVVPDAAPRP